MKAVGKAPPVSSIVAAIKVRDKHRNAHTRLFLNYSMYRRGDHLSDIKTQGGDLKSRCLC